MFTIRTGHAICPRCQMHVIPEYGGAASRAYDDIDVGVCSGCGGDEAMLNAMGTQAQPREQWPVRWLTISMEIDHATREHMSRLASTVMDRDA